MDFLGLQAFFLLDFKCLPQTEEEGKVISTLPTKHGNPLNWVERHQAFRTEELLLGFPTADLQCTAAFFAQLPHYVFPSLLLQFSTRQFSVGHSLRHATPGNPKSSGVSHCHCYCLHLSGFSWNKLLPVNPKAGLRSDSKQLSSRNVTASRFPLAFTS